MHDRSMGTASEDGPVPSDDHHRFPSGEYPRAASVARPRMGPINAIIDGIDREG